MPILGINFASIEFENELARYLSNKLRTDTEININCLNFNKSSSKTLELKEQLPENQIETETNDK